MIKIIIIIISLSPWQNFSTGSQVNFPEESQLLPGHATKPPNCNTVSQVNHRFTLLVYITIFKRQDYNNTFVCIYAFFVVEVM